jgi:hypothetical protein
MALQNIINGANPSVWTSFTTTITATTTSPTLGSGTVLTSAYLQIGKLLYIVMNLSQTSAGVAGSGTYLFSIPSGFTINTAISGTSSTASPYSFPVFGSCTATFGTGSFVNGGVIVRDSTHYILAASNAGASYYITDAYYSLVNSPLTYSASLMIPIN